MKIRFKKTNEKASMPSKAHPTDAGFDLTAVTKTSDIDGNVVYGTGIAVEIPQGYVGLLFPRSSNAKKHLLLSNSVGVIDSGYRGEVSLKFKITHSEVIEGKLYHTVNKEYEVGDRIGQLIIIPYPEIEFEEADELGFGERGENGYGSSGK